MLGFVHWRDDVNFVRAKQFNGPASRAIELFAASRAIELFEVD
jgi:hypothetical protein